MSADYSLPDLLLQENELQFELFNNQTAWQLGYKLKKLAEAKNREFEQQLRINADDYCAHGGAFLIRIKKCGLVGVATISALPQEEDHQMVIDALTDLIDKP